MQIIISKDLDVQMESLQFEFNADKIVDTHIGHVSLWEIKTVIKMLHDFIIATLSQFFYQGFPLGCILDFEQLDLVDFENSLMKAHNGYYIFFFTPKSNISKLRDRVLATLKYILGLFLEQDNYNSLFSKIFDIIFII